MLKTGSTEFKVGLFALVSMATLGYMFFVLSPDLFKNHEQYTYYTVLKNAAGIVPKTHVKTSGVSVGKVKSVELEGGTTKVAFDVDSNVRLPVGSRMEIRSVGLLGDKHLEIIRPQDSGEYIPNKGFLPQSEDSVDMETLISLVGDIARDLKKVTGSFATVLGSKKGEQSLTNIVENVEAVTADLKQTTASLRGVLGEREEDLHSVLDNVKGGVRDLRVFAANLKDVLDNKNKERINHILASFDETMGDVKISAKNISLIAQKVEKGEGTIGKLVNDDTAITELENAIKDIRKVVSPATKLTLTIDGRAELRRDKTAQNYFNIVFRTRPDRFYILGFTDIYSDRIERTTETQNLGDKDNDGVDETQVTEKIRRENALRFNLQAGKRWQWLTVRGGLFETTGGVAADFHLFKDHLKLSFEAFNFDARSTAMRRTAHLKAYASALFYNHLYAIVGLDDPTRTDPTSGKISKQLNWYGGAGLTFDDQDLKALFGAAAVAARM
jgi:phospholipid/cholesterol/gamma-HCH transport system substrate-binding protein